MTAKQLIRILKVREHTVFTDPYKLNIVGVRRYQGLDRLYAFWLDVSGEWQLRDWEITTDPATSYLKSLKPLGSDAVMTKGAAILKEGQWRYKTGLHRGKYKALRQAEEVTVYRDYDRDAYLLFDDSSTETGWFGINIHKGEYSEGCQVFQNDDDFTEFMQLVAEHESRYGSTSFLYTLIDEHIVAQKNFRVLIIVGIVLSSVLAAGSAAMFFLWNGNRKK